MSARSNEIKAYALDLMTDELFEYISNPITEKIFSALINDPAVQTGLYGINQDEHAQHLLYDTPEHRLAAYNMLKDKLKTVAFNVTPVYINKKYLRDKS